MSAVGFNQGAVASWGAHVCRGKQAATLHDQIPPFGAKDTPWNERRAGIPKLGNGSSKVLPEGPRFSLSTMFSWPSLPLKSPVETPTRILILGHGNAFRYYPLWQLREGWYEEDGPSRTGHSSNQGTWDPLIHEAKINTPSPTNTMKLQGRRDPESNISRGDDGKVVDSQLDATLCKKHWQHQEMPLQWIARCAPRNILEFLSVKPHYPQTKRML